MFLSCTYPNDPASGPAFPAEGNVDAQCPQERLRTTQAASEGAGIFGPAGRARNAVAIGAGTQKVGGTARPRAALGHDLTHASGDRVGIDHALDRAPAVCSVGASESADGPQGCFASRRPYREIGHARQPIEVNATQGAQALHRRVEQGTQDARPRDFELAPQLVLRAS